MRTDRELEIINWISNNLKENKFSFNNFRQKFPDISQDSLKDLLMNKGYPHISTNKYSDSIEIDGSDLLKLAKKDLEQKLKDEKFRSEEVKAASDTAGETRKMT